MRHHAVGPLVGEQRLDLGPGAVLVEVPLAERGQAANPSSTGRGRAPWSAPCRCRGRSRAGWRWRGRSARGGGHRRASVVSGSNQRMRSGSGTRRQRVAGRDGALGVDHRAEQRAVDVGGDQDVRRRAARPRAPSAGMPPSPSVMSSGRMAKSMRCLPACGPGSSWPATRPAAGAGALGGEEVHRRVADEAADEAGGGVAVDLDRRVRLHDAAPGSSPRCGRRATSPRPGRG